MGEFDHLFDRVKVEPKEELDNIKQEMESKIDSMKDDFTEVLKRMKIHFSDELNDLEKRVDIKIRALQGGKIRSRKDKEPKDKPKSRLNRFINILAGEKDE
ncbi:hypothetical protein GF336_03900 [Candidatus Woesearchaeota archaeon]|nr:hypothetical protein [Candidatus Woesearchaeota archaeon]